MMQSLFDWIRDHPQFTTIAFGVSILILVGTMLLSPYLAALIPKDYFAHPKKRPLPPGSSLINILQVIIKNLLGLILLVMGLIFLVAPGQGLILIFVALMALDYPGKYRLERWLIAKKSINRGINWLRKKAGAEPLNLDSKEEEVAS